MRLRLRVQRNELPIVNSLWPVSDSQQKNTIAQLLESINQTFPLETDKWGLEDYVVTVGGFECLHYYEISAVCKDEDEVVVRPLTYAEVRARTLMGRSQISGDGRKLEDGIAFGRPLLRAPVRPQVRIPPRKRKRDGEDEDEDEGEKRVRFLGNGEVEGVPLGGHKTIMAPGQDLEDDDEEDEEDDEDFELGEDATSSDAESDSSEASSSSSDSDSSESTASSDSSESSSDSSSDDSTDESSKGSSRRPKTIASNVKRGAQPVTGTSEQQSADKSQSRSLPNEGQKRTHDRNARRRDSKKLAYLKEQNILPNSADISTLREWEKTNTLQKGNLPLTKQTNSVDTDSVTLNGGGSKNSPDSDEQEVDISVERQKLMDSIASGGVEIGANGKAVQQDDMDEGPEEQSNKLAADNAALADRLYKQNIENMSATEAEQASTAIRRGLDVNSAQRLLYGSLGVRTPKNEEQREALQKRLAGRQGTAAPKRKAPAESTGNVGPQEEAENDDPDAWMAKIDLRAVECCDEGVTLSTPPFPFYQRWDPQYRRKKNRNLSTYADAPRKRRRRNQQATQGTFRESYDKYNKDGTGDVLDYDGDGADDDEYWEEGALLGDAGDEDDLAEQQLLNEANAESLVDDFPPLPQDLNTLPALTDEHARKDDYITFAKLECSSATGWQPKTLTQTVQLLEKDGEGGWKTKAALRDLPAKKYDEQGNRVYGKFEMAGLSDDEDDEGDEDKRIKMLSLGELMDLKLLKRAEVEAGAEQQSTA